MLKNLNEFPNSLSASTSSVPQEVISLERLREIMASVELMRKEEPIRMVMLEQGFDPDEGDLCLVATKYRDRFLFVPDYVRFSFVVPEMVFIKPGELGL